MAGLLLDMLDMLEPLRHKGLSLASAWQDFGFLLGLLGTRLQKLDEARRG